MNSHRPQSSRVRSVDVIRGAVMVLMALDHVRVYAGVPAGGTSPEVFFTRWVTHFCAPAFVFLTGVSIFLSARGAPPTRATSRALLTRGLWLVLLELTVIRLAWTFRLSHGEDLLGGVIWAIGWCLVLMALAVHLPRVAVGALGLVIVVGHNAIGSAFVTSNPWTDPYPWYAQILYTGGWFNLTAAGPEIDILYSVVPWIGVMALGYAFAPVFLLDPKRRDRWCLALGAAAIALFVFLRWTNLYGDPNSWPADFPGLAPALAFLNTTKYPASLQFLLMTLGPMLVLVPVLERARGAVADALAVFGRVPMFFYLLHIPLIHAVAIAIAALRTPAAMPWLFESHPLLRSPVPEDYAYSLGLLYAVWAAVTLVLFFACRGYAAIRPGLSARARSLL